MRRNSFKVRPVGFTAYFPETYGNNDIRIFRRLRLEKESP